MTNLITENSVQTLVKGTYKSESCVYDISYTHANGKIITMNINISDINGKYVGSANVGNGSTSVSVVDTSSLEEQTEVVTKLYNEAVASATA